MTDNLVTWEIDLEGDDPRDVVVQANVMHRSQLSTAVVFDVDNGETITQVDLLEETVKQLGPSVRLTRIGPDEDAWIYEVTWRGKPILGLIFDENLAKVDVITWPDGEVAENIAVVTDEDE